MAPSNLAYRVTRQVADQTRNDDSGNVVVGSLIYFTTGLGNQGVVFIADNLLTVKHVKETVAAQAALMDSISVISAGSFDQ